MSSDGIPAADASWRKVLAPHMTPRLRPALLDVATSVVPYLGLMAAMFVAFRISYLLVLALSIPAAGFLVRTFIVFHDCAHGSFLGSKRANALLGAVLGVLLYTPFAWWRHEHAVHHATTGDLDRRGVGDIQTLTVDEYRARSWRGRVPLPAVPQPVRDVRVRAVVGSPDRPAPGHARDAPAASATASSAPISRSPWSSRGSAGSSAGRSSCSCRALRCCSQARPGSGSSTCSISSRTPTGRRAMRGASTRRRCREAPTSTSRGSSASSPATSASTTSTT